MTLVLRFLLVACLGQSLPTLLSMFGMVIWSSSLTSAGREAAIVASLHDMLQSPDGWNEDLSFIRTYSGWNVDDTWVVNEERRFLLHVSGARRRYVRQDLAFRLRVPVDELILRPPQLRIGGFSHRGWVTGSVLYAVRSEHGQHYAATRDPFCFVDLRPILRGISVVTCHGGYFDLPGLVARITARCPSSGFQPHIWHGVYVVDIPGFACPVRDGDVITVAYLSLADGLPADTSEVPPVRQHPDRPRLSQMPASPAMTFCPWEGQTLESRQDRLHCFCSPRSDLVHLLTCCHACIARLPSLCKQASVPEPAADSTILCYVDGSFTPASKDKWHCLDGPVYFWSRPGFASVSCPAPAQHGTPVRTSHPQPFCCRMHRSDCCCLGREHGLFLPIAKLQSRLPLAR